MDIILVGSSELPSPRPARPRRDLIAHEVKVNQRDIEDLCICCGSFQVHTRHPLFEGGMCAPCKDKFLECLFLYDDDGYQSYCSICCAGETLLICENPDCTRCYCFECVDTLVSPGTSGRVHTMSNWVCFLCLPFPRSGLLQRRRKWRAGLKAFYDREAESPLEMYKTVPVWKREPVRVLSLFGDIKKAELMSLGFLENGSEAGTRRHLDDVTNVVRREVEDWGPFDLVYGSTPPLGRAFDRPPGWYLFQFHRILQYARPRPGSQQPFFWMFVDNLVLSEDDRAVATRFLEMWRPQQPRLWAARGREHGPVSPVHGRRSRPADRPRDRPGRPWQDRPECRARVEQHPGRAEQTFGSGFPGGIIFAGSGQAAPRPEPSCACEELLSPPERIFQVFFSRTHFLFINESLYCEKRRLFLEQRQLSLHCLFFPFPIILLVSCLGISGGRSRPVIPLGLEMQAPPPPGPLRGGAKPPGFTRAVRLEALLYVC
ncbi:DNA (cytosine-5)-methyltransferase 3-like isoform X1 [Sus scrofa]|uniref:DNA (cytosine-5)-methyltransferase 3-like isoform X1 n=1 Tax=Sus scrofa TaxID=9823 RepID=UPI000A2B32E9|nr:DNA (cytosine-5)-methyltransferase 3-like isoform X1 [Sus scrofa]XP_020926741.1 DNA (cytosine-5)-methyltransferase 3-like isoform X1 [Sus scrofa]